MGLASLLKKTVVPVPRRAANNSAPLSFKLRLSEAQHEKLEKVATKKGVSVATVLRFLIDELGAR